MRFAFLACAVLSLVAAADTVKLTETEIEFPTYGFSDPNPVPDTASALYPYFRFEGSTDVAVPKKWKAVILENDRIRVTMLPEIGGKVWGAEDKATGRAFVYYNHVVKFRNIALRGPWCSGGIEFNFTLTGHAPTSATPVDWCVRGNADGSASYFAASSEYLGPTWWQVEVRLAPGDDYFTTRTFWHNAANLPGPCYQWMNAAFPLEANTDFVYPGRDAIGHDGFPQPWPTEDGHNLETYAGNFFGGNKSLHVINGDNGMFGIWWPNWKFGAVHRNLSSDKYGRKIWLWSPARSGAIWEDLLTDADGQYAELQSGSAFQQPRPPCEQTPFKIPLLAAGDTDFFEETWGVVRERSAFGDTNVFARPRPVVMPKEFDWTTPAGLVLKAEQMFRYRHDDDGAKRLFEDALKADRFFIPALTGLSALEARRGHFQRTAELSERALAVDTYEPLANYLAGLAAMELGDLPTARERLGLASHSPATRSVALTLLARVALRERKFVEAKTFAERSLAANAFSPDARHLKAMALRLAGDCDAAKREVGGLLDQMPLFHAARYELALLGGEANFLSLVRGELPAETIQDIAERYAAAGQIEDACRILAAAADSPLARLQRAWLQHDVAALADIAKVPTAFAFPFRPSMRAALEWAASADKSWKFKWYLALYLAANGDGDRADSLLAACGDEPEDPVFFLYVASRGLGAEKRRPLALAAERGAGWRADMALARLEATKGDRAAELAAAERLIRAKPESNAAKLMYAKALLDAERYQECVKFLEGTKILPSEFGENGNAIWREAWYALGDDVKAESYPENLGEGKPFPQDRRPYEFKAAHRDRDDVEPIEGFEGEVKWSASAAGGAAKAETTDFVQLFGHRVLRLSYRGGDADNAVVTMGPEKPIAMPANFDSFYVWVMGNHFGAGANRDRSLPNPRLSVRFAAADGSTVEIDLGSITWPDWHQVNYRFKPTEIARLRGGSFLGFTLKGGTQSRFLHLHFDDISVFVDK